MPIPRDKTGYSGGRIVSTLRWWPPQESEQQVPCCWKRFNGYLNIVASQQTKKLQQSSETGTVSSVLHEKHSSNSVMRVNWIQGYQKEGSYTSQKRLETTQRKGLARTVVKSCKVSSAHKRCIRFMYTHVQTVFLHHHCWELCFPLATKQHWLKIESSFSAQGKKT